MSVDGTTAAWSEPFTIDAIAKTGGWADCAASLCDAVRMQMPDFNLLLKLRTSCVSGSDKTGGETVTDEPLYVRVLHIITLVLRLLPEVRSISKAAVVCVVLSA